MILGQSLVSLIVQALESSIRGPLPQSIRATTDLPVGDEGRNQGRIMKAESPNVLESVHLSGYQRRDLEVVDYRMRELAGTGLQFRGPFPKDFGDGAYFTCIGAAQTLGCFCEVPYPALLEERTGLPALNLGYGGAGPEFFAHQPPLQDYVRRGKFAVIQVMSGRSQSNSLFECGGLEYLMRRSDGRRLGADEAYQDLLSGPAALRRVGRVGRRAARVIAFPRVCRVVEETRRAWVANYRKLLHEIGCPTVLLWFSKRVPDYVEDTRSLRGLFGEFPQLVTRPMVEEVAAMCTEYVECVTAHGSPQPLFSRFTGEPVTVDPAKDRPDLGKGEPWTHNQYYPSPEMHAAAAAALMNAIGSYVS